MGILSGNCPESLEIYLGCQLAGVVAVPLNYRAVTDDLAYVLGNCSARAALVDPQYLATLEAALPRLPSLAPEKIFVLGSDRYRRLIDDPRARRVHPRDALVIPKPLLWPALALAAAATAGLLLMT